ncbi:integrator complex subunit 6 [Trichuris trichiura]|uniref:Integrator complex subunit 6 n=1 Tax=Trichuris trichiura TaxID=36087 RepID=A0A077ZG73_TRITR|nr:integrator complex subunit 6 [Trichuris trichiura]
MTIILFLVDTSASMNQMTSAGISLLDVSKNAIDTILKHRARDQNTRGIDRYMLLTFEDSPHNVKAGWKESQTVFMDELRTLSASGFTKLGSALSNAFHLLNINRLQSGIDNFGHGRYPHWLEPAVVIVFTDGNAITSSNGITDELDVPRSSAMGSELISEPFRWDQRIFAIVLRMSADLAPNQQETPGIIEPDGSPIDAMCDATGGRSYRITSMRMLNQCLESLVLKLQTGVVLCFEKFGNDVVPSEQSLDCSLDGEDSDVQVELSNEEELKSPDSSCSSTASWHKTRKMIYVPRISPRGYAVSHWPIPENFWPDPMMTSLPTRTAVPVVKFSCRFQEPDLLTDFPFDKYELEPSPLTKYILDLKKPKHCWHTFLPGSSRYSDLGCPFGFLKASWSLCTVSLFVLPYDFPTLFSLIEELRKKLSGKPTAQWCLRFEEYVNSIPPYYMQPLKNAMQRIGFVRLVPEVPENFLNVSVLVYLSNVKGRAKEEFQQLCASVGQNGKETLESNIFNIEAPSLPAEKENDDQASVSALELTDDQDDLTLCLDSDDSQPTARENEFTYPDTSVRVIPRNQLMHLIQQLRLSLGHPSVYDSIMLPAAADSPTVVEDQNAVPVASMGNYQEHLKRVAPPLRDIEPAPARQQAFGNPFKVDKRMLVDETDIGSNFQVNGTANDKIALRKDLSPSPPASPSSSDSIRKRGPLPEDYNFLLRRQEASFGLPVLQQLPLEGYCPNCQCYMCSCVSSPCDMISSKEIDLTYEPTDDYFDEKDVGELKVNEEFDEEREAEEEEEVKEEMHYNMADEYPHEPYGEMVFGLEESEPENDLTSEPSSMSNLEYDISEPSLDDLTFEDEEELTEGEYPSFRSSDISNSMYLIRKHLSMLIRRPGRDYSLIFDLIRGEEDVTLRRDIVCWAVQEAERFKRRNLSNALKTCISL